MYKLGIIGIGKMGEALLSGVLQTGFLSEKDILGFDKNRKRLKSIEEEYQITAGNSAGETFENSRYVLVCVKPQNARDLLDELADSSERPVLITIMAGVPSGLFTERIEGLKVIRVMPNTPALVKSGITAISGLGNLKSGDSRFVKKIFQSVGDTVEVEEKDMDAVTAISGSGPAYVFRFIESLQEAGVLIGLNSELSIKLALKTVLGSVRLLEETGKSPSELTEQVSSPGGTTINALKTLEEHSFKAAIMSAVESAYKRSRELGDS